MYEKLFRCYTFSRMVDQKKQDKLKGLFKLYPQIIAVYLYGSQVGGYASKKSDLDVAVVVNAPQNIDYGDLYLKTSQIIKGFELDLRVATLKNDPTYLFEVIRGKCFYQRSERDRINFETMVLRNFYDGKHIRDIYYHYLKQSFGVS